MREICIGVNINFCVGGTPKMFTSTDDHITRTSASYAHIAAISVVALIGRYLSPFRCFILRGPPPVSKFTAHLFRCRMPEPVHNLRSETVPITRYPPEVLACPNDSHVYAPCKKQKLLSKNGLSRTLKRYRGILRTHCLVVCKHCCDSRSHVN